MISRRDFLVTLARLAATVGGAGIDSVRSFLAEIFVWWQIRVLPSERLI